VVVCSWAAPILLQDPVVLFVLRWELELAVPVAMFVLPLGPPRLQMVRLQAGWN
jgi:hypothetical protein